MKIRSIKANELNIVKQLIYETFNAMSEPNENNNVTEHELVDNLRLLPDYDPAFDVVAIVNNKVVGHAFLSTVLVGKHKLLCLAPITVQKEFQGQGIGAALINYCEAIATTKGYQAIFILGNPNYYGKFNYVPAANYYLKAPFAVDLKAFMVKELYPNSLQDITGVVQYLPPFGIDKNND